MSWADEIAVIVARVESELSAVVFPYGDEVRHRKGLHAGEVETFGIVLGKLHEARYALDERMPPGVELERALDAIREARDALDLVHHWRLPDDEAKIAWADAKRSLGEITGQGP